jgi:hypothetical protein
MKLKISGVTGCYATYSGIRKWHWYTYNGGLKFRLERLWNYIRSRFGWDPFKDE